LAPRGQPVLQKIRHIVLIHLLRTAFIMSDSNTSPDPSADPSAAHPTGPSALRPPALSLLLAECRVAWELAQFEIARFSGSGAGQTLPSGDGHTVMVVPGFGASDFETAALRSALAKLGYYVHGWGQGRNLGMRPGLRERLDARVRELAERNGPISLIGWSLGGIFVREMARRQPKFVRRVFTLGSPFNGDPEANHMMPLFRLANRGRKVTTDREAFERRKQAPPVPCVAIYSRTDGIIAWPCARELDAPNTENVEIHGSHFGLVCNLEVLAALAERLHRT